MGEVVAVERAQITHEIRDGAGTLRIGEVVSADMEPFRSPDGATITTLRDSAFSTVPGSPAYVGRAHPARAQHPARARLQQRPLQVVDDIGGGLPLGRGHDALLSVGVAAILGVGMAVALQRGPAS